MYLSVLVNNASVVVIHKPTAFQILNHNIGLYYKLKYIFPECLSVDLVFFSRFLYKVFSQIFIKFDIGIELISQLMLNPMYLSP